MKAVPKYITSIQIPAMDTGDLNISLGFEKNGTMMLNYQDTAYLDQDSKYINEAAYPNTGIISYGKYEMWLSMFTRHLKPCNDNELE